MKIGSWNDASGNYQLHDANVLTLKIEKARNTLGWKSKLNSSYAITSTMNWYKLSKEDTAEFTNEQIRAYQNMEFFIPHK
jgi:hypothetical protein